MPQDGVLNRNANVPVHTPNTAKIMEEAAELLQLESEETGEYHEDLGVDSESALPSEGAADGGGLEDAESTENFLDDVESFLTSV
eukprot:COSAG02_NODE_5463_length_4300_cov_1.888598_5_plen_85_part_00